MTFSVALWCKEGVLFLCIMDTFRVTIKLLLPTSSLCPPHVSTNPLCSPSGPRLVSKLYLSPFPPVYLLPSSHAVGFGHNDVIIPALNVSRSFSCQPPLASLAFILALNLLGYILHGEVKVQPFYQPSITVGRIVKSSGRKNYFQPSRSPPSAPIL